MATAVVRGKAQVSGINGWTADVILYPSPTSVKLSHRFEESVVKDNLGYDCAWRGYNEMIEGDLEMILIDQTGSPTVAHAKAGAAFFAMFATVTISGCDVTALNTTYQVISGAEITLKNTDTGVISFKLRRYVDSTQNTLAVTTPS